MEKQFEGQAIESYMGAGDGNQIFCGEGTGSSGGSS